jgi:hypothetical protein
VSKDLSTIEHKVTTTLACITMGLFMAVVLSTGFWYLWNITIPDMFPLRRINWVEALSIFIMAKILFRDKLITDDSHTHCNCEIEEETEEKSNVNDKT